MKRTLLIFLCLCALPLAAQDMKSVFLAMPDSLTPLLTSNDKADFIDFLDSGMKAEVRNRFGQMSEMTVLTEDYAKVRVTEASTLEMKLLPTTDSTKVVCVVRTVCAPACDSEVRFYTSDWREELDVRRFLQLPVADAFYLPMDSAGDEALWVRKQVDVHLMRASLSADDSSLTFLYTSPERLGEEERKLLLPYLRKEPLVFRWDGGKF